MQSFVAVVEAGSFAEAARKLDLTSAAIAARIRADFLPALSAPGWIKPDIAAYPLAEAASAQAEMEGRRHRGKLVLVTGFGAGEKAS